MKRIMKIYARTDIRGRQENQDNLLVDEQLRTVSEDGTYLVEVDSTVSGIHIAAVADGVGGADFGRLAAKMALLTSIREAGNWEASTVSGAEKNMIWNLEALARKIVDRANDELVRQSQLFHMQMATTLSLLLWDQDQYCAAFIGDSPIYLFRDGKLRRLGKPQTEEQFLRELHQEPDKKSRHCLEYYIGHPALNGREMVDLTSGEFADDDIVMLCTDGLVNVIDEKKLGRLFQNTPRCSDLLQVLWKHLDKDGKKGDNCTVLLLKVNKQMGEPKDVSRDSTHRSHSFFDWLAKNKHRGIKKGDHSNHWPGGEET